jgi:hypothetical protein
MSIRGTRLTHQGWAVTVTAFCGYAFCNAVEALVSVIFLCIDPENG